MTDQDQRQERADAPARRAGWATAALGAALALVGAQMWLEQRAEAERLIAATAAARDVAALVAAQVGRGLDAMDAAAIAAATSRVEDPSARAATALAAYRSGAARLEVWSPQGRLAAAGSQAFAPINHPLVCLTAGLTVADVRVSPAATPGDAGGGDGLIAIDRFLAPSAEGSTTEACPGAARVIAPLSLTAGLSAARGAGLRLALEHADGAVLLRAGPAEPFPDGESAGAAAVTGWPLRVTAALDQAASAPSGDVVGRRGLAAAALLVGGALVWALGGRRPRAATPAVSSEGERFLRAVLDTAPLGLAVRDAAGRVRLLNQAGAALLGVSAAEALGRDQLLPPGVSLTPRDGERAGPDAPQIMGLRRDDAADEAPKWLAFSVHKAGDATVAVFRDAEREVIRAAEHAREGGMVAAMVGSYRLALEHMDQGVTVFDADDCLTLWNHKALELIGVPFEAAVVGASLVSLTRLQAEAGEFGPVDDLELETARRVEAFRSQGPRVARRRRPNGQWIEYRQSRAPDGSLITLMTDATDRIKAEAAARETYDRTVKVLNALPDAVITADDRGLIESFNAAAEQMFGWMMADVVGRSVSVLMPERFRIGHEKVVADYQGPRYSHVMGRRRDLAGRRRDGETFPLQAWVGQLRLPGTDSDGKLTEGRTIFCAVLRDVSADRQAQIELRMAKSHAEIANRAKSEFLLRMNHELRSPLNAVLGFSDLIELEAEASGLEDIAGHAALVRSHGGELLEQIDALLAMADLQTGVYVLRREPVDLVTLANERLVMIEAQALARGVTMRLTIGAPPPLLDADPEALRQAMDGVLANAVRFAPPETEVACSVSLLESAEVQWACVDHGPGMDDAQMRQAFEAFAQCEGDVLRREQDGAGVGLALARDLVELHGGDIELSTTPGGGLTAAIRLPLTRSRTEHAA